MSCPLGLAADRTLDSIAEAYETRQGQLSQIHGHWRSTIDVHQPTDSMLVNVDCRFAVKGAKRLYEVRNSSAGSAKLTPGMNRDGMSFDGRETRILLRSDCGRIWSGDMRAQYDAPDQFLALQGYPKADYRFRIPKCSFEPPCDFAVLLRSTDYRADGHDDVAGATCLRVTSATDCLWLDPARQHALIKREVRDASGELRCRYSCDDFAELLPHLWLARRIVMELIDGGEVTVRSRMELVDVDVTEVPDALFTLRFEPGTRINDMNRMPKLASGVQPVVGYDMPARPEDLDRVASAAVDRNREAIEAAFHSRGRAWRWGILVVNILIVFAICALLFRRWRRNAY